MRNFIKAFTGLAMIVAVLVGIIAAPAGTALAASNTVLVTESNMNGWVVLQGSATGDSQWHIVTGPGTPPLGAASLQMTLTTASSAVTLGTSANAGATLQSLTRLDYYTYESLGSAGATQAVYLQLNLGNGQGSLIFEPDLNGAVQAVLQGTWQHWDALNGKWWATNALAGALCSQSNACTFAQLLTQFPGAAIDSASPGVVLRAGSGSGWAFPFVGYTDALTVGISGSDTTYNFDLPGSDTTPPVITPSVSPLPNAGGWNNSLPVTLTWNASDPESGIASSSGCGPTTFTAATPGTTLTCTATNGVGLTSSASITVKIDNVMPTVTPSVSPAPNAAGWNNVAPVSVTWAVTGGLSGIASQSNCGTTTLQAETTGTTVTCTATSGAGLTSSPSIIVRIDLSFPTITAAATAGGSSYTYGNWTNQTVTVAFTCADAVSGVASCTSPMTFTTSGAVTGTATDKAGNTTTVSFGSVNVDQIPPTIKAVATKSDTSPYTAGTWTNQSVTVTYSCTAPGGSPVTSCASPQTFNGPGVFTATGSVTNGAGNSASASFGPINIDNIPPTSAATATQAGATATVVITVTDTGGSGARGVSYSIDNGSQALLVGSTASPGNTAPIQVSIQLSVQQNGGGNHTVYYRAIDFAGNREFSLNSISVSLTAPPPPPPADQTPPEAYNQFDPATKDVLVFGRDADSGVAPGPVAPASVVPVKWGARVYDDDNEAADTGDNKDDNAGKSNAELRTYNVFDLAGNRTVLVEMVKKDGHSIKVQVMSIQYGTAPAITPPKNEKSFEWSVNKDGSLNELEQKMVVGQGKDKQEVSAKYDDEKNQTTINDKRPNPDIKIVKPGLALLRLATNNGALVIEY